jgi:4-carboxymuconolactone decarboxylase
VRGALRNGVTKDEIRAVLMQASVYCGVPLGLAAFRVASEAIKAYEAEIAGA